MRHLKTVLFVMSVVSLSLSPAVAEQELSRHGKRIFRNAKACFDRLAEDDVFFDGTTLGAGKTDHALGKFHEGLLYNIGCVQKKLARVPAEDRSHPDYKRYLDRANGLVDYANAMKRAIDAKKEALSKANETCRSFMKDAGANNGQSRMNYWFQISESQGYFNEAERAMEHLETITKVAGLCELPKYAHVGTVGCDWLKRGGDGRNPQKWCEVAAKRKKLGLKALEDYATSHLKFVDGKYSLSAKKVTSNSGWLPIEGPTSLEGLLESGRVRYRQIFERARPVAKVFGNETYFDDPRFLEPFIGQMKATRDAVLEHASTWKMPKGKGGHYGAKMAKKAIKKMHKKVSVKKAFKKNASWTIIKRATGIPESRWNAGYVVFKLPGEKYCQVRDWVVSEPYAGGGRYQKATAVRIKAVRWQKCK